ncbi:MAG: hypothetical protein HY422_02665 [Candidatus Komeilibacteria bacterium]|nr:hypothetical protein [Candidatus Komeilibacteria bacterium]
MPRDHEQNARFRADCRFVKAFFSGGFIILATFLSLPQSTLWDHFERSGTAIVLTILATGLYFTIPYQAIKWMILLLLVARGERKRIAAQEVFDAMQMVGSVLRRARGLSVAGLRAVRFSFSWLVGAQLVFRRRVRLFTRGSAD